ncbi:MAG: DnaJ C-terminal domain-containing protein [Pseudomonadota bacterium]
MKSAYRKLAKKLHPDQNAGDLKAKERFAELGAAYEILGDDEKRRAFDRGEIDAQGNPTMAGFNPFGGNGMRGRAQSNTHPNFDDLFSQFSSGRGAGYRSANFGGGMGGGDVNVEDMLRSMFGGAGPGMGAQSQQTRRQAGSGGRMHKGEDVTTKIDVTLEQILAGDKITVNLPGSGPVKVALPENLSDGQVMRLKGKGHPPGTPGGQPGDALITIHLKPHARFKIDGHNLVADLPVALKDAVLGAKIEVQTLDGKVAVNVPRGASSGSVLRLKGRGLPTKGGQRGDLFLKTQVKLPDGGDEALEALMMRWRTEGKHKLS